jgi:hypothetical protein
MDALALGFQPVAQRAPELGGHLRTMLGITSSEFRQRFPFPLALDRFIALMLMPYRKTWEEFHPLTAGAWDSGP